MPSSGKFKVKVAKIIRETSIKFDDPNTKMDEVGIRNTRLELVNKWLMCFPY